MYTCKSGSLQTVLERTRAATFFERKFSQSDYNNIRQAFQRMYLVSSKWSWMGLGQHVSKIISSTFSTNIIDTVVRMTVSVHMHRRERERELVCVHARANKRAREKEIEREIEFRKPFRLQSVQSSLTLSSE